MSRRRAVVVGAGIGGLTAAVALHRRGWEVGVHERSADPAPGAGIVLAPNALRAFDAIGFDVERATGSAVPAAVGLRRPDGRWLQRARTEALTRRYGRPPLAVHRAALTAGLAAALPPGTIRYASTVRRVDDAEGAAPVVRTAGGDDVRADVVIAADGINSPLRRQYFPAHPGLHHSGETAWRTVVTAEGLPPLVTTETWGRGERFGVVPLADGRVYVYATAVVPPGTRPADVRTELARRFGRWHDPVPALLDRLDPDALLQHDLYDLAAPLPRLHHGRLAWLGDAAHAMTPNLGQGGCQAIEDAVVLAHLLDGADRDGAPRALAAYSAARRDRTDAIRVRARRAGRVAALRNPLAAAVRDFAVRATPARLGLRAVDDLYDGFALPSPRAAFAARPLG
ncbi:FAD-dependent monooxygenase [Streptomyces antimicrobicus]|uniref:FAD-dependent monooxygenase n=1 Tax=Streptomyces antimicrobicus TaxID=2883108 RepID=A0ABS8BDH7_9ACTN|nr:FAD-dependent monooxygenase [Streptomyces antimicrobicus]MCB5182604.1 FAD-dependent monooxygenase [Streptomyces antimicrobicus]